MGIPRVRAYDLKKVMDVKHRVQGDPEVQSCIGGPISGEELDGFVSVICNALPGDVRMGPVEESVIHLAGDPITEEVLSDMAWRLAGNLHLLRQGVPALPWTYQPELEWVPMQCVEVLPRRTLGNKLAAKVKFRVLAGSACPNLISKQWTQRFMRYLSTSIGFSKPWGDHPFVDIHEFTGLRMHGLLDPELSVGGPDFEKVKATSGLLSHNQELINMRRRLGGFKCPVGYSHRCFNCPVGYDKCPAGSHPRTYTKGFCQQCEKDSWVDPRCLSVGVCVDCMNIESISKKEK
jgi:hypothetical protein